MEKQFEVWHQAAQGLFGIGLLVLLVALVTASFHICCCHCCRESFAIATVIGSLIIAGLLLVTFSLAVFGIFSTVKNNVQLTGSVSVFEWAYYVSIGGVGVALLAAILFIVDGCRGPSDSDGDGEETAKMV
jgi:glucan phosphoethanolaminetransferase (alkaline phosphatase superfamily)